MLILYICKVSFIHQETFLVKASLQKILSQALPNLFLLVLSELQLVILP